MKGNFEFILNVIDLEGVQAVNDGTCFFFFYKTYMKMWNFRVKLLSCCLQVNPTPVRSFFFFFFLHMCFVFLLVLGTTVVYKILVSHPVDWQEQVQGAISIIQESRQTL